MEENHIRILLKQVDQAEAIVVGAASGMSASDGKDFWYRNDENFYENFGDFYQKYGFTGAFNGFYHPYSTEERRWAFLGRLGHTMHESKAGEAYHYLMELIKGKNSFVVTTNQDMLFHGLVPEDRLSTIQGDWNYLQCGRPCHDKLYPSKEMLRNINAAINKELEIPSDMVPRCPRCGAVMEPWVRGYHFLEGKKYKKEYEKWYEFVIENQKKKILFLELGVGRMTPMFIQEPFWNFTYRMSQAFYITINPKHALLPKELEKKGIAIKADIRTVLELAVKQKETSGGNETDHTSAKLREAVSQ